jgi:hypothetical protein
VVAILKVASFFSGSVRDLPYSLAALNPYPLPSLLIFGLFVAFLPNIVLYPMVRFYMRDWIQRRIDNYRSIGIDDPGPSQL